MLQERFHRRNSYSTCVDWRESWLPMWVMIADVTHDCLHRAPQACRRNVGSNIFFCGNVMTHDCRRESWLPTWLTLHSISHQKHFLVKRSCAISLLHYFLCRNSYGILLWKRLRLRKLLFSIVVPAFSYIRRRFHSFSPKLESTYYYFTKFPKINSNSLKPHVSAPLLLFSLVFRLVLCVWCWYVGSERGAEISFLPPTILKWSWGIRVRCTYNM